VLLICGLTWWAHYGIARSPVIYDRVVPSDSRAIEELAER
jgi:hypothetical protein